jgi:hypothetical protein
MYDLEEHAYILFYIDAPYNLFPCGNAALNEQFCVLGN